MCIIDQSSCIDRNAEDVPERRRATRGRAA